MSKPDWKTKPHERKRMTLQQENQSLKARIDVLAYDRDCYLKSAQYFRDECDQLALSKDRYAVLRTKDVMVLDGEPKYLKGEDLDKYCDEEHSKFWGTSVSGMSSYMQQIGKASALQLKPTKIIINASQMAIAQRIMKEEQQDGMITPEP